MEEEGLEGVEENLERGDVVGEGGYLKEESHYQMMAEGDKVPPDQENSKGKKNPLRFSFSPPNSNGRTQCCGSGMFIPDPDFTHP